MAKHFFWYADSVVELTAVLVDDLYELLRYGRCAVEYDWELRQSLAYFFENVETKLWLGTRLELERAVGSTDCNCERVNARLGYELFNFFRACVRTVFCGYLYVVLNAG